MIKEVASETVVDVTTATIDLLMPYKNHAHTITTDKDQEFSNHGRLKNSDLNVLFTHSSFS
ncbi:hypothetical protein BTN49_2840 [Candidatus Enterovibrio escicola]|uniref:Uncharacterized protein n=1 Tax=Candidatus Enterovibrio escicola TaxID=1927127 RepID=A0A2A5T0C2_9GAMM|nr:hypothetical protein BTN49_2840 [Candidatus Enterovibrio escacola]